MELSPATRPTAACRECLSYAIRPDGGKTTSRAKSIVIGISRIGLEKKSTARYRTSDRGGNLHRLDRAAKEQPYVGTNVCPVGAGGGISVEQWLLRPVRPLVQQPAALLSAGAMHLRRRPAAGAGLPAVQSAAGDYAAAGACLPPTRPLNPAIAIVILAMKPKAIVSWSGGKDCMLALWHARTSFDIAALVTTVTAEFNRISMHGVRVELLQRQAASLGLPLSVVEIPYPCSNAIYEEAMRDAWNAARANGVERVICGDLFLEDVRRYREERLFGTGACIFPLWGRPTRELAGAFIGLGFQAVLCCVDTQALAADFAGRAFDAGLLRDLPAGVDPCGENGEFHTFVHAGPLFSAPIDFRRGKVVLRDGRFAYCDLVPVPYEPEA